MTAREHAEVAETLLEQIVAQTEAMAERVDRADPPPPAELAAHHRWVGDILRMAETHARIAQVLAMIGAS